MYAHRYPHKLVLCHMCYFLCMDLWNVMHVHTYFYPNFPNTLNSCKSSVFCSGCFSTCVAESEFLPDWRKYHQPFFLRDKSRFFPFSFLPSPLCRLGASVEHTAAEAMRRMNFRWCPSLSWCQAWCLVEIGSLQGSVNTSCHMNVNIFGWLQMRSGGSQVALEISLCHS